MKDEKKAIKREARLAVQQRGLSSPCCIEGGSLNCLASLWVENAKKTWSSVAMVTPQIGVAPDPSNGEVDGKSVRDGVPTGTELIIRLLLTPVCLVGVAYICFRQAYGRKRVFSVLSTSNYYILAAEHYKRVAEQGVAAQEVSGESKAEEVSAWISSRFRHAPTFTPHLQHLTGERQCSILPFLQIKHSAR
ncbi:hypothetical protein NMY22_g4497 [Coprinellus aureogranulatus]|nr:hypothetical protein NMY22_g4497 [Coprinellus aureogranulatus]